MASIETPQCVFALGIGSSQSSMAGHHSHWRRMAPTHAAERVDDPLTSPLATDHHLIGPDAMAVLVFATISVSGTMAAGSGDGTLLVGSQG